MSENTWLIYALGGGWGHLTRALALGRIAAQRRPVRILTNSPYLAHIPRALIPANCQINAIHPQESLAVACQYVQDALGRADYGCLIVDTFPRGLAGELATILPKLPACLPRILIHRDLKPEYVQAKAIASFVAAHYHTVLVPGEGDRVPLAHLPIVEHTDCWLIRSANELPDWSVARSLLRLSPTTPTVIVCAAGQPSELNWFGGLTHQLAQALPMASIRCLTPLCPPTCPPELWGYHYPGIDCLQVADVVVSGAGYNTVAECAALNVPLVTFALKRLYDRQAQRAQRTSYPVDHATAAIALIRKLLSRSNSDSRRTKPTYSNGATQAVDRIEHLMGSG